MQRQESEELLAQRGDRISTYRPPEVIEGVYEVGYLFIFHAFRCSGRGVGSVSAVLLKAGVHRARQGELYFNIAGTKRDIKFSFCVSTKQIVHVKLKKGKYSYEINIQVNNDISIRHRRRVSYREYKRRDSMYNHTTSIGHA